MGNALSARLKRCAFQVPQHLVVVGGGAIGLESFRVAVLGPNGFDRRG
jgi:hypothetical protein